MEYLDANQVRLQRLLRVNTTLKALLIIILIILAIFLIRQVWTTGVSAYYYSGDSRNVISIIKQNSQVFFNSFSEPTSRYLLFVALIFFMNVVLVAANEIKKFVKERRFVLYSFTFIISVGIAFSLPMDEVYEWFVHEDKTWFIIFCIITIIPGPYFLSDYIARDRIRSMILSKTLYIIICGLLIVQIIIE